MVNYKQQAGARKRSRAGVIVTIIAAGLIAGCAGNDEQETIGGNIQEAYDKAAEAIQRKNYRRGIQIFEAIQ